MAPAWLPMMGHPLVDAWTDGPTGGDTDAVRLLCGNLCARMEEALIFLYLTEKYFEMYIVT